MFLRCFVRVFRESDVSLTCTDAIRCVDLFICVIVLCPHKCGIQDHVTQFAELTRLKRC